MKTKYEIEKEIDWLEMMIEWRTKDIKFYEQKKLEWLKKLQEGEFEDN